MSDEVETPDADGNITAVGIGGGTIIEGSDLPEGDLDDEPGTIADITTEPEVDDLTAPGGRNRGKYTLPATVTHQAFSGEGKHYRGSNQPCG